MLNIFKYEFKTYIKSILIWVASISTLLFFFMALFPTFSNDAALMDKILENYPEEMLKAFGMNTGMSMTTVAGFLVFAFAFVQLLLAVQAANYGFSILSIEEREFTADYLMSKPVSRTEILNAKFGAAFLALLITNIVFSIITFITIEIFREGKAYEFSHVLLLLGSMILFQLFFLSIGMMVTVLTKKISNVLTYALGISFGTYILNAIGAIIGGDTLRYFSPFAHFEPGYILEFGKFDISFIWISLVIIMVSLITTYVLYPKRNIHSL